MCTQSKANHVNQEKYLTEKKKKMIFKLKRAMIFTWFASALPKSVFNYKLYHQLPGDFQ